MDVTEFTASRGKRLDDADKEMHPLVAEALGKFGKKDWDEPIVTGAGVLWLEIFQDEAPKAYTDKALEAFKELVGESLSKTATPSVPPDEVQIERVTRWIGTLAVNNATFHGSRAAGARKMRWVTRHDNDVRHMHQLVDGKVISVNDTFDVGGYHLHYPGEPIGPPDVWINCRCLVASAGKVKAMTKMALADPEVEDVDQMDMDTPLVDDPTEVPWHAVLAPEGVASGDKRVFAVGALSARNLPLPISFQRVSAEGHGGSVVVARMNEAWRGEDNMWRARGVFSSTVPEAQDVISGIAEGIYRGLSVDVDDYEIAAPEQSDGDDADSLFDALFDEGMTTFSKARIAGASIVAIPAFQESYIALGPDFEDDQALAACGCTAEMSDADIDAMLAVIAADDGLETTEAFASIDEGAWDGSASAYTPEQWYAATILHKNGSSTAKTDNSLPIKTPDGKLSRAGVHAAASRISQVKGASAAQIASAKTALKRAYATLGEDAPDSLTASASFAPGTHDGPGWITNPRATERIRKYWTHGKGSLKIRWGIPGDFNRCRRQLVKYVQNPEWLAGLCANMHKEAIGLWPGQEDGGRHANEGVQMADAFSLVASSGTLKNGAWFVNPELSEPTPLAITDDGHIFGHVAAWDVCHVGLPGCETAPHSLFNYAYFLTGLVHTDTGDVPVGHVTMGIGHAGGRESAAQAAAHYDNTNAVVADVSAGEDIFGIWVSGQLRSEVTDEQRNKLQAAALSGDWRVIQGNREMIAALAVNVPGFPIPRMSLVASADGGSLTAAGIVMPTTLVAAAPARFDAEAIADLVRGTVDEVLYRQHRGERVAAVRDRLGVDRVARLAAARAKIES